MRGHLLVSWVAALRAAGAHVPAAPKEHLSAAVTHLFRISFSSGQPAVDSNTHCKWVFESVADYHGRDRYTFDMAALEFTLHIVKCM